MRGFCCRWSDFRRSSSFGLHILWPCSKSFRHRRTPLTKYSWHPALIHFYGELSKEEFMSQKSEIAEQLQAIESQRTTIPVQKQPVLNVEKIRDTLNCLIDFTQPKLDEMLLDKVVDRVIPITNDHFRWELNLLSGEHNAVECSIKGRKNKASVSIEETVRSDTLSNISSEKIAPTGGPLDRPPSKIRGIKLPSERIGS